MNIHNLKTRSKIKNVMSFKILASSRLGLILIPLTEDIRRKFSSHADTEKHENLSEKFLRKYDCVFSLFFFCKKFSPNISRFCRDNFFRISAV